MGSLLSNLAYTVFPGWSRREKALTAHSRGALRPGPGAEKAAARYAGVPSDLGSLPARK